MESIYQWFDEIFEFVSTFMYQWNEFGVMIRMTSRLNFERMYSIDIGQIQYEKIIIILLYSIH